MKTAGQLAGQPRTCPCQDSQRTGHTQTQCRRGFAAGQMQGQTQDCPVFCPFSSLGEGQKDEREQMGDSRSGEVSVSSVLAMQKKGWL